MSGKTKGDKKMKKILSLILLFALTLTVFGICATPPKTAKLLKIGLVDDDYIAKRWGAYRTASQEYVDYIKKNQGKPNADQEKIWKEKEKQFINRILNASEQVRKKEKMDIIIKKNFSRAGYNMNIVIFGGQDVSMQVLDILNK